VPRLSPDFSRVVGGNRDSKQKRVQKAVVFMA